MPTFVLMTKLSPEVTGNLEDRESIGKRWKEKIREKCPEIKWICHYSLLGPYDFLDIYEAPDEETAAKVSLITASSGALKAESWTAIPYGKFLDLVQEVTS
ncbi:GYD domain-containing protein [Acidobacteriota bacterium]